VNVIAVKVGVPGGIGDLHGVHSGQSLGQSLFVFLHSAVGIETEHSSNALGNGFAGDHHHVLFGQSVHLLGGHNDVLVVGQHEHGLGRHFVHSLQNILGAGIHGLTAGNDAVYAQITEYGSKTVAGAYGHYAQRLFRLCDGGLCGCRLGFLLVHHFFCVLQAHIFDLYRDERAVVHSLVKGFARVVGVDVDLDDLVVVHQHKAVAQTA